jgi:phosphosulfolactate phosphohydrolase-like enzyme
VLHDPLLVGELGGNTPYAFHLSNSPAQLASLTAVARPIILLSTSGTRVIWEASATQAVYAACLRNYTAQAAILAAHHPRVAIVGAGARREFRMEDQMACAWIAELLLDAGYEPLGETAELVKRWSGAAVEVITDGTARPIFGKRANHATSISSSPTSMTSKPRSGSRPGSS